MLLAHDSARALHFYNKKYDNKRNNKMRLEFSPGFFYFSNRFKIVILLLFIFSLLSVTTVSYADKKSYLRLEKNEPSELNDLTIRTLGALVFENDMEAHIDLTEIQSNVVGKSVALDFGAGYLFNLELAVFVGAGISLDYNLVTKDFNDKYYTEVGAVYDLTNRLSITSRVQHFYNQPDIYDKVIMIGVLFRD